VEWRRLAGAALLVPDHARQSTQQPVIRSEEQSRKRDLDQGRGQNADEGFVAAQRQHHVEPGVAEQKGAAEQQNHHENLAAFEGAPGCRAESGHQRDVETYPCRPPAAAGVPMRQGDRQVRDPGHQHNGSYRRDGQDLQPSTSRSGRRSAEAIDIRDPLGQPRSVAGRERGYVASRSHRRPQSLLTGLDWDHGHLPTRSPLSP
jgi:hypothetical protein